MQRLVRVTIKPAVRTDMWYRKERHSRFIGKTFTGVVVDFGEDEFVYINFEEPVVGGHNYGWEPLGLEPTTSNIYGFHPKGLHIEAFKFHDPPSEGEWE